MTAAYAFEILKITRNNILKTFDGLSIEELNRIPDGFNNNLIWNFGHVIATQQILCYGLSGNKAFVSNEIIDAYRKGTKPENVVSAEGLEELKKLSEAAVQQMEKDYAAGLFKEYKSYTTSYGTTISSIEEAIMFNNVHEGLHFGYCIALRKVIL
ncbi:MAG: DinB family protein [Spirosomaceae bacterium]|nr:DinB family protein [Spirosomataceae bacterium]